ncbi:MAG: hypothetical protein ABIH82_05775 [Candidatus Woesearchaeota archaeon]
MKILKEFKTKLEEIDGKLAMEIPPNIFKKDEVYCKLVTVNGRQALLIKETE